VLFFVSVGMGFHIGGLLEYWPLALATLAICMLAKPIMAAIMVALLGKPMRLSLMVGGSLSQIGEFSFILATLIAGTYNLLPMEAVSVITGVAIVSITLNAALYRFVPVAVNRLEDRGFGSNRIQAEHIPAASDDRYRILLVGYGPCGELVSQVLRRHDMEVVVLEMNIDTVTRLQKDGLPAMHGDASNRTILRLAGVEKAKAIIISTAAAPAVQIASAARSLNPDIRVVAHTSYIRVARAIVQSGDAHAFAGEAEVALAMSSHMLRAFGATDEQVMRERDENYRRLFGDP
jgi:CPA2 family monovalent cation:H+ antiporter-2